MKIVGITAEYNPFHNGHKYHLEQSKALSGADYAVAVMSGNFTQRGEPAVLDKWTRSRLAVEQGVDLVLELPFVYACSRAEKFASGAVDILKGLGVSHISFGSESGDLDALVSLVTDMKHQEEAIEAALRENMDKGVSYAKAQETAVSGVLGADRAELMLEPNNILSIEYLKRVMYWKEKGQAPEPVAVKRHGSGYFDVNSDMGFAGASAVRRMTDPDEIRRFASENVAEALQAADPRREIDERMFQLIRSDIVRYSADTLSEIYCMGEGLENRLKKEIVKASDLDGFIKTIVSKRYTEAAVRRLLVYVLLNIRDREPGGALYARVLAAGPGGRKLLKKLKKQEIPQIPVITNINKEMELLNEEQQCTLHYDILASDMYNLICGRDLYDHSDKVVRPYIEV